LSLRAQLGEIDAGNGTAFHHDIAVDDDRIDVVADGIDAFTDRIDSVAGSIDDVAERRVVVKSFGMNAGDAERRLLTSC